MAQNFESEYLVGGGDIVVISVFLTEYAPESLSHAKQKDKGLGA